MNNIDQLRITLAGRLLYALVPYRRKVVMSNIDQVFKDSLTNAQKTTLAKAFYSHLATSMKEMLALRFMSDEVLRQSVEVRGYQNLFS